MRVPPLLLLSLFAAVAFADEECPPRYSYCGYSGPDQWPNLPIAKNECGKTKQQSPINLPKKPGTPVDPIKVEYISGDATIENSGHDIRVMPKGDAGGIKIGGKDYWLVNFHFHTPSEHRIDDAEQPAEIHFVHTNVKGNKTDYLVVGVMLIRGNETDPHLAPVFADLPTKVCAKSKQVPIKFKELLTELTSYYTYVGSLTTPPCTEGVNWYVIDKPRTISEEDLKKLVALGRNKRPPQKERPKDVTYVIPKMQKVE